MKHINIFLLAICSLLLAGVIGYKDYLGSSKLFFFIEMEASASGISQIYFDTGHGYNGTETIEWHVQPGASRKYSFPLPELTIKSIRFDPSRSTSVTSIKKAGIENAKGESLKDFPAQSFRPLQQISKMDVSKDVLVIHTTDNANDPITEIENSSVNGEISWTDFLVQRGWIVVGYALLSFIMFMGLVECRRLVNNAVAKPSKAKTFILTKTPETILFVFAFIIVLSAMQVLPSLKARLDADRGAVLVDMVVNVGASSNMWVNDAISPPIRVQVQPDVRKVYEYRGVSEDIRFIRLDPVSDIKGAVIRIYSIEIQSPTGGKQKIGPSELAQWQVFFGRRSALTDSYIEFVSTANINLSTDTKYHLAMAFPAFIHKVVNVFFDLSKFTIIIGLFFLCLIFVSMRTRSWVHVGIVLTTLLGIIILSQNVATANIGSISVAKTVGLAAFSGHPLTPNKLFIALSTLLAGIAAGAAYLLTRKYSQLIQKQPYTFRPQPQWWQFGILIILIAAFTFPDVMNSAPRHAAFTGGPGGIYIPEWDSDNAITWWYMIKNGDLPFRDFWYPYALSFAYDIFSPWGDFFQYIVWLGLFGATFYFTAIVSRAYWAGVIIIFAILLGWHSLFPQPERHLFPFVICLTYIAASWVDKYKRISIWPFWLATCAGLIIEPSQVAYAALGVGLVLAFDIFETSKLQWRPLVKRLVRDFAVPAVFLGIMVIVLALSGVIQNISDLYLEMGSVANYMALPTSLDLNLGNIAGHSFFLIAGPFVILALGIFERTLAGNSNDLLPKAIMAVGAIGIMQLQKHGVRPIDWALFYSSAIGIVLYSVLLSRRMGIKSTLFFGSMVGLTAAIFINAGIVNQSWQRLVNAGQRFATAAQVVTMDAKQLETYRADQLSPARLKLFGEEAALLDELKSRVGHMPAFYSLPDAQLLYILAGAKPPYQINGFNTSPIFEQIKMVDYLRSKKIEYVIVEPSKMFFDGISNFVRLPVLYNYVVANYVPDFATKRFSVFRLRKPGEQTSLDAWISILGETVNLGHLPVYSMPPESPLLNCESNCEEILKVTLNKTEQKQLVTIPFMVNGKTLSISFVAVPGKMEYWIKLNRIWFWAAQSDGVTLVQLRKSLPAGMDAQIFRSKLQRPERLY